MSENRDFRNEQPARRWLPALAVVAIALVAALPFLRGGYPQSDDGMLHVMRALALDDAVRQGDLWPRFLSGLHYGFGSPIFNYSGPLSLYPVVALRRLGIDVLGGLKVATVAYTLLAAFGAYLLGRMVGGPLAGVVAAAGYVYSPLFLFFGNLAHYAAAAMLPWVLWSFARLARRGGRIDFVWAALSMAAVVLTHNITALYTAVLVAAWALFLAATSRRPLATFGRLAGAGLAALVLSAFLWLPALLEIGSAQLDRLINFDFHDYFLPLTETIELNLSWRNGMLTYTRQSLHWPQTVLGFLGGAAAVWTLVRGRRTEQRTRESARLATFFLGLAIGIVFLTTASSVWVWETVPLMHYVEFPSRLLSPAALALAVLSGWGVAALAERLPAAGRAAIGFASVGAIVVWSFPLMVTEPMDPTPAAESILDVHEVERTTGWLGGTSAGEYLPAWVEDLPHSWALTDRYLAALEEGSTAIPRLHEADGVTVDDAAWHATGVDLTYQAEGSARLVFDWFYYPGWVATVDGRAMPVTVEAPAGLLAVEAPAGAHHLQVAFRLTPLRRAAQWVSLAALAVLIGLLAFWRRIALQPAVAPLRNPPVDAVAVAAAAAAGLAAFVLRLVV